MPKTPHPSFDPLPPGYSGPAKLPRPPQGEQPAPPGEPEVLEEVPFELSRSKPAEPIPTVGGEFDDLPQPRPSVGGRPVKLPENPEDDAPKIRTFEQRLGSKHEDTWSRSPNVTGTGAIHVKSFHSKLTGDSLEFLDKQVNEWLDKHPQYEVKLVTSSIGTWTGKLKEPNLILNIWV